MKKNKGFTLIELIIYISLSSMMLLSITLFAKMILQVRTKNQVMMEVEQQGIQITQILTHAIRNAENIIQPTPPNINSNLILDMLNVSEDPTVFSLDNNVINIQEGVSGQINLSNSRIEVQDLTFQNFSRANTPGIISFSFTLNYNNQSSKPEYNYSKIFYGSISLR